MQCVYFKHHFPRTINYPDKSLTEFFFTLFYLFIYFFIDIIRYNMTRSRTSEFFVS